MEISSDSKTEQLGLGWGEQGGGCSFPQEQWDVLEERRTQVTCGGWGCEDMADARIHGTKGLRDRSWLDNLHMDALLRGEVHFALWMWSVLYQLALEAERGPCLSHLLLQVFPVSLVTEREKNSICNSENPWIDLKIKLEMGACPAKT